MQEQLLCLIFMRMKKKIFEWKIGKLVNSFYFSKLMNSELFLTKLSEIDQNNERLKGDPI